MLRLEPGYRDAKLRIASSKNMLFAAWLDAPEVSHMRELSRATIAFHRANPKGAGFWNAIVAGTPRFSQEVREEGVKLLRANYLPICAAHVIVLGGLAGAASRAFMSTLVLVGRPAVPTKVFSEPSAGAAWVASHLGPGGDPLTRDDLLALHAELVAPAL